MVEKVFGFQILFFGLMFSGIVEWLTGAGWLASLIGGVILGGGLFMFLMAMFPRAMFFGMVAVYAVLGFMLADYFEFSWFSTLLTMAFAAGLGWLANVELAQDSYFHQLDAKEEQEKEEREKNPTKALLKDEDAGELLQQAERAFATRLITRDMYARITAEILQNARGGKNAKARPAADIPAKPRSAFGVDDKMALVSLSECNLIRPDEWPGIAETADTLCHENETRGQLYAQASGALYHLAECRAIGMDTFLRAMLEIDPDYPPSAARIENFPYAPPDVDAKDQAKYLFQAKLIDVSEYREAFDQLEKPSSHAAE